MSNFYNNYILAFDVGGTAIKWRAFNRDLQALNPLREAPSYSTESTDVIINSFGNIILESLQNGTVPQALCFGFPGPFDYAHGISHMKGLAKYESLYGLDFGGLLRAHLTHMQHSHDWSTVPFFFENDATCFGLGEYFSLTNSKPQADGPRRMACFTLGTGLGSTFIENGQVVRGRLGIPATGMIFDQPYEGRILDDLFSRRGLIARARTQGISADIAPDVKEIASLAHKGDRRAIEVFLDFGRNFAHALDPWLREFQPDIIVFGGKIAKTLPLFLPGIEEVSPRWQSLLTISDRGAESAILGAALLYPSW